MDDNVTFKPNEDDVLKVLAYLRTNLPEQATPEKAILLLRQWNGIYDELEKQSPTDIEAILKDLEAH